MRFVLLILFLTATLPSLAHAELYPIANTLGALSQFHCRQLIYSAGDNRPLDRALFAEIAGQKAAAATTAETLETLWRLTTGRPDWGFLIGDRWQTASREQRKTVNFYQTALLVRTLRIAPVNNYEDTCPMQITTTLLPDEEIPDLPSNKQNFPQARALKAMSQTQLPNGSRLTYTLKQLPLRPWEITDVAVNGNSLQQANQAEYNHLLVISGWDGLIRYLVSRPFQQNNP